jgi:hypothetical protein
MSISFVSYTAVNGGDRLRLWRLVFKVVFFVLRCVVLLCSKMMCVFLDAKLLLYVLYCDTLSGCKSSFLIELDYLTDRDDEQEEEDSGNTVKDGELCTKLLGPLSSNKCLLY